MYRLALGRHIVKLHGELAVLLVRALFSLTHMWIPGAEPLP